MKTWIKVLIVTLVVGFPAFLAEPNGPLGGFWAPPPGGPEPEGAQLPLFQVLGLLDALMLGLGVSFLVFGYPLVKAVGTASRSLTLAAHLSITWVLIQWWAHGSLHISVGLDLSGLLAIEYGFHVTIMIASLIMVYFFLTVLRQERVITQ